MNLIAKNAFADVVADPRVGQRFLIVDTSKLVEIPPVIDSISASVKIIFNGRIRNIAKDKFKGENDYIGEVSGDEDGWFYSTEAIFSCDDIIFNPIIDGYYIGNKTNDEFNIQFEKYSPKRLKDTDVAETTWAILDQPYVWSLEDACKYVGLASGVTFNFPWDLDEARLNAYYASQPENTYRSVTPEENREKYKVFLDKLKPKSYTSLYGKSVTEWLEENLLDNFSYSFSYNSTGSYQCNIINKSLIDTTLFPKALFPSSVVVNNRATNVSITEVQDTYTQVEVVSSRVMFAGTVTTKNLGTDQKTLDRDWEYADEKNYAYGNESAKVVENPGIFRAASNKQKAWTNYKFVQTESCPICVSNPLDIANEFNERDKLPFFPQVGIKTTDGTLTISTELSNHQTPDTSNMAWSNTLPYGYSDTTSKYYLFEPFVSTTVTTEVSPNKKSILHLYGNTEKPALELGSDVKIISTQPQVFGYIKNDAKLFEINGQTFEPSTSPDPGAGGSFNWSTYSETTPNPAITPFSDYKNFTHWSMIYVTLAGYSKQRISLFKLKDNPGISTRRKVIQANDCEYWIAHAGAFKPTVRVERSSSDQGYDYVPEVVSPTLKVLRNDFEKQKSYLDMYAAFLFIDKKAVTLDYTLDGWDNSFYVGQPIYSIEDGQTIITNSVVESIEYFIESSQPRIRVSTLIPELPPLKKFGESIRLGADAPKMSPLTKYREPTVKLKQDEKVSTITKMEGKGGGGGAAAAAPVLNSWIVTGINQILLPSTLNGIKWVATAPTATTQDWKVLAIAALTPMTPAGIGICQNIETQELRLIANVGAQVPWRGDLVNGNLVSLSTKTISITGVAYTDPITNLEVIPVYTAYIPSMRY